MRTKKAFYIFLAVAFLAIMIVGSRFDLEISKAFAQLDGGKYLSPNGFARFFEVFGETPIYAVTSLALWAAFLWLSSEENRLASGCIKLFLKCFAATAAVVINLFGNYKVLGYLSEQYEFVQNALFYISIVCGGLSFTALWYFFAEMIVKKEFMPFMLCALIVLITALCSQIITQALKLTISRARFRMLYVCGDYRGYTEWFVPNGLRSVSEELLSIGVGDDGYKSFPSGHTTSASILFTLNMLPLFVDRFRSKKYKIGFAVFSTVAVVTVAFSRIVMGAHYLTDVVFAAAITLGSYYFARHIVTKKLAPHILTKHGDDCCRNAVNN